MMRCIEDEWPKSEFQIFTNELETSPNLEGIRLHKALHLSFLISTFD